MVYLFGTYSHGILDAHGPGGAVRALRDEKASGDIGKGGGEYLEGRGRTIQGQVTRQKATKGVDCKVSFVVESGVSCPWKARQGGQVQARPDDRSSRGSHYAATEYTRQASHLPLRLQDDPR